MPGVRRARRHAAGRRPPSSSRPRGVPRRLREPRHEERDEPRRACGAARRLAQHVDRRRLGRRRELRQHRAQAAVAQRVPREPGRQVRETEPVDRGFEQRFRMIAAKPRLRRRVAALSEAPRARRRHAVPGEAVVSGERVGRIRLAAPDTPRSRTARAAAAPARLRRGACPRAGRYAPRDRRRSRAARPAGRPCCRSARGRPAAPDDAA